MDYPDSPDAVALALFDRICNAEEKEDRRGRNVPTRHDMLALYAECLKAVHGDFDIPPSGYIN